MLPLRRLYARWLARLRRLARRTKNTGISTVASVALWYVRRLNLDDALKLGARVGDLAFLILRKPRRLAEEHLRLAFGDELSPAACTHIARASLVNMGRSFCEIAKIDDIRQQVDGYVEAE